MHILESKSLYLYIGTYLAILSIRGDMPEKFLGIVLLEVY